MKKIFLSSILILFLSCDNIEIYKKHYDNGQLSVTGQFKNGKRIGEWKAFYENGVLKEILHHDENEKVVGEKKTYYENGVLKFRANYENNFLIGNGKYFHKNGQLSEIGPYEHGKPTGIWKFYFENGNLKKSGEVINEKNYNGLWKYYHENGQLKDSGVYINANPDGEWKSYHKNGQTYQIKYWTTGKLINVTSCFDGKGNDLDIGTLKNGNGILKKYDISGNLIKEISYVNGEEQE
ncbi:toxin-antitoxin system YwqK family antitoxin [Lacinutrix sp.]|uniref:toxin-antitoxin system YwqK family antitoxin n=1 Tax=Lacinutrix sp. TaxID=1937692 RepID=UPI0025BF6FB9|nr:toxin-antitoxin system YwqK family antitoxin [Lacinutrix sp.]